MLEFRSPLIWGGAPAGLALGVVAWMVFGGAGPVSARIGDLETRLTQTRMTSSAGRRPVADFSAVVVAHPVFAVGGASAVEATVSLFGVAVTPARAAALVSINGKPPEWLDRGVTREGVTLQEVLADKVVIDTATGPKDVPLGAVSAPEAKPAAAPGR